MNLDLTLAPVVVQFGQFLKVIVTLQECDDPMATQTAEVGPSAFDVMCEGLAFSCGASLQDAPAPPNEVSVHSLKLF